jgi:hypothetical protein
VTEGLPEKIAWQPRGRAGRVTRPANAASATRGGEAPPFYIARKTTFASQVRQRTGRGGTSAADTETIRDPGSYPLRDIPGNVAGPVLQHRPSETPPMLRTELEGLAM